MESRMTNSRKKIILNINSELEPIVPRFLELRHEDIKSIDGALEHGDFETITRMGHSMKGSGAGYGFDYISEIGVAIEKAAKENNTEDIRRWVDELSVYLEKVEVVYDG
jgi:HPt (histidine-containing phosphotransfer) domain-containing protein